MFHKTLSISAFCLSKVLQRLNMCAKKTATAVKKKARHKLAGLIAMMTFSLV
jgi:hypothetical protein